MGRLTFSVCAFCPSSRLHPGRCGLLHRPRGHTYRGRRAQSRFRGPEIGHRPLLRVLVSFLLRHRQLEERRRELRLSSRGLLGFAQCWDLLWQDQDLNEW